MRIGDLIETHKVERGIILDIELVFPNHPSSPPRAALISWLDEPPRWHRKGVYAHISGVKRVISYAGR